MNIKYAILMALTIITSAHNLNAMEKQTWWQRIQNWWKPKLSSIQDLDMTLNNLDKSILRIRMARNCILIGGAGVITYQLGKLSEKLNNLERTISKNVERTASCKIEKFEAEIESISKKHQAEIESISNEYQSKLESITNKYKVGVPTKKECKTPPCPPFSSAE